MTYRVGHRAYTGLPWWFSDKKTHLQCRRCRQVWSLDWEDPLEKEMATHSSILAQKIPWTKEPGSPQGCEELDTTEELGTHACMHICYKEHNILIAIFLSYCLEKKWLDIGKMHNCLRWVSVLALGILGKNDRGITWLQCWKGGSQSVLDSAQYRSLIQLMKLHLRIESLREWPF